MGFTIDTTVRQYINVIGDTWPPEFICHSPQLQAIPIPSLMQEPDHIRWIGRENDMVDFTISLAWKSMNPEMEVQPWTRVVWNKIHIPKHAVCLWNACHRRLPTQDRIMSWKQHPPDMKCLLCHHCLETHNHLFFQCDFSKALWDSLRMEVGIGSIPDSWEDILAAIEGRSFNNWSSLHCITFTAAVYYIWQERNRRLFDNNRRDVDVIFKEARGVILQRMAWKRNCRHANVSNVAHT